MTLSLRKHNRVLLFFRTSSLEAFECFASFLHTGEIRTELQSPF
jgi:hypothetical protein